ncbi:MAG: isoprenylcysteine carboxylmethyltransferase family protein, partial [bacterium]
MSFIPIFKIGVWNAWIFMSIFVLQMLVIIFVGKRVSERSHVPKEVQRSRLERYTGIIAHISWLLALGYSIFLPFQLQTTWFYIGLFVFIVGLILMTIATIDFITAASDQLITKGAYRFSRHPIYLATFFICLGAGIASVSFVFIFISIIMAFCLNKEAFIEERYCLDKYGRAYQEYLSSVSRWIN